MPFKHSDNKQVDTEFLDRVLHHQRTYLCSNWVTYFIDSQGCLLDKEQFYLLDEQNCCIKMTEQQVDLLKTKGMLLPVDKFCWY